MTAYISKPPAYKICIRQSSQNSWINYILFMQFIAMYTMTVITSPFVCY